MRAPNLRPSAAVKAPAGTRTVRATSSDGVALVGVCVPGGPSASLGLGFVLAHGFTGSSERPDVRRVLAALAVHGTVVALDFRGHGRSGGTASVGDTEVADVAAAVVLARGLGCTFVVAVGFSMGASVVVRHAGGAQAPVRHAGGAQVPVRHAGGASDQPDAVVSVSGPARWWCRDTKAMRRVSWLCEQPLGRVVARLLGVRLSTAWEQVPSSPVEDVHRIAPRPLLVVHGARDHYFTLEHPRALVAAAGGGAELWVEDDMDHAESATTNELAGRIGAWGAHAAAARVLS